MDLIAAVSPAWAVKRAKSRIWLQKYQSAEARFEKAGNALRGYDAAKRGRRLGGWIATDEGPAGANGLVLSILRERSRDLSKNNPFMAKAMNGIQAEVVGSGIIAKVSGPKALQTAWKEWAESTDCDADGRLNFYGIQSLVIKSVAESGECFVRRRWRKDMDIPFQLQVIEPDMIADNRLGLGESTGNIKAGISFDRRGRRTAYHLYKEHPGSAFAMAGLSQATVRVDAQDIIHVYRTERPGQIRGVPWAAPVITRLRLLDDYEDAALERARVAACFAAFIIEPDDSGIPKTVNDDGDEVQPLERLEPGIVETLTPGRDVKFGTPPSDGDYDKVTLQNLRAIAAGFQIPYELLTGDYSRVNFTSGRMGQLSSAKEIKKIRSHVLIPHLCQGVFGWFKESASVRMNVANAKATWTPPRAEMVDPTKETAALVSRVRSGLLTWDEAVREQGYDPDEQLAVIAAHNAKVDELGITLDTDPRNISQAGQTQAEQDSDGEEKTDDETNEDAAEAAE